jgi:HAD superfamily hydrolase (TIGR01509 family)
VQTLVSQSAHTSARSSLAVAFVFDMDGTILDNMAFHTAAWMQTLLDLGLPSRDPVEWEHATSGVPNREIFTTLLRLDLDTAGVERWVLHKERLYRELSAGCLREISGLSAFLDRCRHAGIRLGLATGAGPENIQFNLRALQLQSMFGIVVGAADVTRGKPDPEIFLTAAERLSVSADRVIVFEDAPLGILAANAAAMPVVAVDTMLDAVALCAEANVARTIHDYEDLDPIQLLADTGFDPVG